MKKIPISIAKGHWAFVDPEKVVCIESKGNNSVVIVEGNRTITVYKSLSRLIDSFPCMVRICVAAAINIRYLDEIKPISYKNSEARLSYDGFKTASIPFPTGSNAFHWQEFKKRYLKPVKDETRDSVGKTGDDE